MKIKKLGHCCLLIETNGKVVLTDPGNYSTMQDEVTGVDIILFTHEHPDHFHLESLKKVLANNPNAKIITNIAVGKLLDIEEVEYEVCLDGQQNQAHGVLVEGYGDTHAEIYKEVGLVENTGYFVDGKLFYPGDAFTNPGRPVDVLAVPVAGPWMKLHEAIDYGLQLKPRVAFPVHDGMLKFLGPVHRVTEMIFAQADIKFVPMIEGTEHSF